jgi:hypothetical protein
MPLRKLVSRVALMVILIGVASSDRFPFSGQALLADDECYSGEYFTYSACSCYPPPGTWGYLGNLYQFYRLNYCNGNAVEWTGSECDPAYGACEQGYPGGGGGGGSCQGWGFACGNSAYPECCYGLTCQPSQGWVCAPAP